MLGDLDQRFPAMADLENRALKRIPYFASEYLRGGIDRETGLQRNRADLDRVVLTPSYLNGTASSASDFGTKLLGQQFDLPFGISPVGLTGLMWPGANRYLAKAAYEANIPVGLSNFATTPMQEFRDIAQQTGWYQMYPANDAKTRTKMIEDVKTAGFDVLVLTIDVPGQTRRHREFKIGLTVPPKLNLRTVLSVAAKPTWAVSTTLEGIPKFRNMQAYVPQGLSVADEAQAMTDLVVGRIDLNVIREIRDQWPGKLVLKGILTAEDAVAAKELGADAIWVSNHGGRQLDASPSTISILPGIRSVVGKNYPVIVDSGVRTGLDVIKMLASGADFVFLGRAFMFGVCALGRRGPAHVIRILDEEMKGAMTQLGCPTIKDLKSKYGVA